MANEEIKQRKGILGTPSGTYNLVQFCKNGVIRLKMQKTKKNDTK